MKTTNNNTRKQLTQPIAGVTFTKSGLGWRSAGFHNLFVFQPDASKDEWSAFYNCPVRGGNVAINYRHPVAVIIAKIKSKVAG